MELNYSRSRTAEPTISKTINKMARWTLCLVTLSGLVLSGKSADTFNQKEDWKKATSVYDFHAKNIDGQDVSLQKYKGQVLIITNVASHCGLTETNYKQLQSLYEEYGTKGLKILAFPCNQFNGQEPGTSEEIKKFASKYNVTFDMFEKIDVNGDNAHPLWKWMKDQPQGAGTLGDAIKWNFTKFLINKEGKVVDRYAPTTEPLSMKGDLEKQLKM